RRWTAAPPVVASAAIHPAHAHRDLWHRRRRTPRVRGTDAERRRGGVSRQTDQRARDLRRPGAAARRHPRSRHRPRHRRLARACRLDDRHTARGRLSRRQDRSLQHPAARRSRGARASVSGLLLLLVDAMRWDYVERTTFLRRLARRSAVGRFQEPFGFTPRAAYFRGMDTEPDGFTFMFEWNPSKSPFGAARFTDRACAAAPRRDPRVREGLAARARDLSSPFARA